MKMTFFLFLFMALKSFAISVYPLTNQFKIGSDLSKVYEIRNDSKELTAMEIRVESRIQEQGKEINESSELISKNFKIFPQSLIIQPNQMKAVRVSYVGPKNIEVEQAYRIVFTEKPIKDPLSQKKFRTLIEFNTSAFIAPSKSSPKVKILNYKIDGSYVSFVIKNEGNAHQTFENPSLVIKQNSKEFKLGKERKELVFNLLAGESREIRTLKPEGLTKISGLELNP